MSLRPAESLTVRPDLVPDPHGHAAILLVESLLHGLIARKVITVTDAVEIVDTATEVTGDRATAPSDVRSSIGLLESISTSLSRDLPR